VIAYDNPVEISRGSSERSRVYAAICMVGMHPEAAMVSQRAIRPSSCAWFRCVRSPSLAPDRRLPTARMMFSGSSSPRTASVKIELTVRRGRVSFRGRTGQVDAAAVWILDQTPVMTICSPVGVVDHEVEDAALQHALMADVGRRGFWIVAGIITCTEETTWSYPLTTSRRDGGLSHRPSRSNRDAWQSAKQRPRL